MQISTTVILSGIIVIVVNNISLPCVPVLGALHMATTLSPRSLQLPSLKRGRRGCLPGLWRAAGRTGRSPDSVWWRFSEALTLFERILNAVTSNGRDSH